MKNKKTSALQDAQKRLLAKGMSESGVAQVMRVYSQFVKFDDSYKASLTSSGSAGFYHYTDCKARG